MNINSSGLVTPAACSNLPKRQSVDHANPDVSKPKSKRDKNLAVYIVEQHNDVLPFIHRAIGSRQLPFSEILFIHLDSHPDLLIPIHLDADTVKNPQQLYESISIENWLLPLTYAKHVNHIVWIKPPWAHQIKPSCLDFTIGKCQESGKLRLNSKENYFLTDGLFCPADRLTDLSDIKLTTLELCPENWPTLGSSDCESYEVQNKDDLKENSKLYCSYKEWTYHLQSIVKNQPYILDMDLDFFSTANPFKGLLNESEEKTLKKLYRCPPLKGTSDEEITQYTALRHEQLLRLETIFSSADELWSQKTDLVPECEIPKSLSEITGVSEEFCDCFAAEEKHDIVSLCQSLLQSDRKTRDISFNQLHDFGCTLDDTELPHHLSSQHQVDALEKALKFVMKNLPKPAIVTISRSSYDEYCPVEHVDSYQTMFLNLLKELFGELDIIENY